MNPISKSILTDPQRLRALQDSLLLDSPAEETFDRLSRLAAKLLDVPAALVTLVDQDRQFFKSCIGLSEPWSTKRETPLSHSFCQYVVITNEPLIIEDARKHPLVMDNLAIAELNVIAYLGMPLITEEGMNLGSFCVVDSKPRQWSEPEIQLLGELSHSVMSEIELRVRILEQARVEKELSLLLEINRLLSTSLELPTLLPQIAERLVPEMADWTIIHLHSFAAQDVHTGIAHREGRAAEEAILRLGKEVRGLDKTHPVWHRFFRSGEAELGELTAVHELLDQMKPEQRNALSQLGMHSFIRVPIWLSEDLIGIILLVRGPFSSPFKSHNLLLVEKLAQMASIAAQNYRLYQQAQQALVRRDEFMQTAAHEVKNPITAVRLGAELLARQLSLSQQNPELMDLYGEVMVEIKRLERLVHDLFDISLVDVGQLAVTLRRVNITAVVNRTLSEMRKLSPSHQFVCHAPDEPLYIMGDKMRLEQMLYNLLRNAVKYTRRAQSIINVRLTTDQDSVQLSIQDEGIGIEADQIPYLFERLYRVNTTSQVTKPGLGVGLYLVSEIVRRHNGRIDVESVVGQGSTFTVCLPLSRQAKQP